jgi:pyruvate kinase
MSTILKRTKILSTLGPSTNSSEMIEKLAAAGVNGFRLNFSHGSYEERDQQIAWIRQMTQKTGKPVAIVEDLQGPKIRLGDLKNNVEVKAGDELIIDYAAEHDGGLILPIQYNLAKRTKVGEPLYIFDGKIRTTITEITSETAIKVRVENAGTLMSHKGVNLPNTDFGGDIITPKDLEDIKFGSTRDIDYMAMSFIQNGGDIDNLRQVLKENGSQAKIIAKIETKSAIIDENLEAIVKASDGVMVARGDMAVEAGAEVVPIIQRRIISLCRKYNRLCIVATQMMGSMVDAPEPTRAEVSDVSNAVVMGTDAVMTSEETAMGHYPAETVAAMKKVILYTQEHEPVAPLSSELTINNDKQRDAISQAAITLASQLNAAAIIVETKTGAMAENLATHRPNLPIISVTSETRTAQQLTLRYGNHSYVRPDSEDYGLKLAQELKSQGFFGDQSATVVVVSGHYPYASTTDTIKIYTI